MVNTVFYSARNLTSTPIVTTLFKRIQAPVSVANTKKYQSGDESPHSKLPLVRKTSLGKACRRGEGSGVRGGCCRVDYLRPTAEGLSSTASHFRQPTVTTFRNDRLRPVRGRSRITNTVFCRV